METQTLMKNESKQFVYFLTVFAVVIATITFFVTMFVFDTFDHITPQETQPPAITCTYGTVLQSDGTCTPQEG